MLKLYVNAIISKSLIFSYQSNYILFFDDLPEEIISEIDIYWQGFNQLGVTKIAS